MKKLVFCNRRGGCGKTVTAYNVAYNLATLHRKRVLVVDSDPQGTLTAAVGATPAKGNLYTAIKAGSLAGNIQTVAGFDLLAAADELEAVNLAPDTLDRLLEQAAGKYDLVIMDTQPANNAITAAAIFAADLVFVTSTADKYALAGVVKSVAQMVALRKMGAKFKVGGLILTNYESRGILYGSMAAGLDTLAGEIGTTVLKPAIRKGIAAAESMATEQALEAYEPKSKPAQDYRELTKTILKVIKKGE